LSTIWNQEWKNANQIDLGGHEGKVWEAYTTKLKVSHLGIEEVEDELVWSKNSILGIYTPKLRYKSMYGSDRTKYFNSDRNHNGKSGLR
jgi:hypothetical protein